MDKVSLQKAGNNRRLFDTVRDLGPSELIDLLEQVALLLPGDTRYRLRRVLASAHGEDGMQRALNVVLSQWEGLRAEESIRIAMIGPARTGKSSLVAALGEGSVDRIASLFSIIDLQGLEEYLGYGKDNRAVDEVASADVLVFVLDGSSGFTRDTLQLVHLYASLNKPFVLVLNKMDRVEKVRAAVAEARQQLQMSIIPVSVFWPGSVRRILKAIVSACPRALYPLAQNLPAFRRSICRSIVTQAVFGSGLIGALPIPVGDVIPISAVQIAMLLKIARAHGFRIDRGRAGEILPVLAAGLLVREGCHRLTQAYPEKSTLLSVSVGSLWTYTVGIAAISYFERLGNTRDCLAAEAERLDEPLSP